MAERADLITRSADRLLAAAPLIVAAAAVVLVPTFWPAGRAFLFLALLVLIAGEFALIGWFLNGRLIGFAIDNRNRISLSKLQASCWTVIVLAAFVAAAAYNARVADASAGTVSALAIQIPGELLLAMGISGTSLVATPALLSLKAAETAADPSAAASRAMTANGKVAVRATPAKAELSDLVTGDEVGNATAPDLSKIQQLLISLLLMGVYAWYVYEYFAQRPAGKLTTTLPKLDESFVWLMGISHASYLAYKAAPHTQSAS